jgi:phage-related protein
MMFAGQQGQLDRRADTSSNCGLWEVRSTLTGGRIARVMFCMHGRHLVLLHGFIKKTQQTPDSDLDLAMKRKKEIER